MIKYYNLLLIISLLFSFGCGKELSIKVSAKNPVTGEPYPNLSFEVYCLTGQGKEYGIKTSKKIYSGELGENGESIVEIKEKNNRDYYVIMEGPDDICYRNYEGIPFKNPNIVDNHFNYEFVPCAYLKFRYKNIDCQNDNDYFKVFRMHEFIGYKNFLIPYEYFGCEDYTMENFVDVPMGWWFFKWEVRKNEVVNYYNDSIYIEAGEYRTYEINY